MLVRASEHQTDAWGSAREEPLWSQGGEINRRDRTVNDLLGDQSSDLWCLHQAVSREPAGADPGWEGRLNAKNALA